MGFLVDVGRHGNDIGSLTVGAGTCATEVPLAGGSAKSASEAVGGEVLTTSGAAGEALLRGAMGARSQFGPGPVHTFKGGACAGGSGGVDYVLLALGVLFIVTRGLLAKYPS